MLIQAVIYFFLLCLRHSHIADIFDLAGFLIKEVFGILVRHFDSIDYV